MIENPNQSMGEPDARQAFHDIRMELQSIALLASKLARIDITSEQCVKVAGQIQKAVRRATDVIATQGDPLQPECLDINDVIRDMQAAIEPECENRGIDIDSRLAPSMRRVRVIRTDLEIILRNLLANAIEAMPHGGKLSIESVRAEQAGARLRENECDPPSQPDVMVSVTDTGIGMSAQLQQMIFQPYFSTKGERRGIGLSAIEMLVRRNNGSISVCSAPGAGTRFQLLLCSEPSA